MVKFEANGKARLILNLSAHKGSSVNEGIDKKDYPAKLTLTMKLLKKIESCNTLSGLGDIFLELCFIFGCSSSVGTYDRFAKVVLFIALQMAGMPASLVVQQIDDVVACGPPDGKLVEKFDRAYIEVAEKLGVVLASRDDPEKSFSATTRGQVLGIWYDSESWTWWIGDEKLAIILNMLKELILSEECEQWVLWKICGKIINIMVLLPPGKFNVDHIIRADNVYTDKADRKEIVQLWPELKDQMSYLL